MYISGELFKNHCDWSIDDRYPLKFEKEKIKEGDSIFMKISDISKFLSLNVDKKIIFQ